MNTLSYKTVSANKTNVQKDWLLVDASGKTLGRLASDIAFALRGKHKTNFTPHIDCGDNVVVINAEKVDVTGSKLEQKEYIRHTGYPGGQRSITLGELQEKHPERVIEKSVRGMLPKNRLGRAILGNLHVYMGSEHPHAGQNPKEIDLNTIR